MVTGAGGVTGEVTTGSCGFSTIGATTSAAGGVIVTAGALTPLLISILALETTGAT